MARDSWGSSGDLPRRPRPRDDDDAWWRDGPGRPVTEGGQGRRDPRGMGPPPRAARGSRPGPNGDRRAPAPGPGRSAAYGDAIPRPDRTSWSERGNGSGNGAGRGNGQGNGAGRGNGTGSGNGVGRGNGLFGGL